MLLGSLWAGLQIVQMTLDRGVIKKRWLRSDLVTWSAFKLDGSCLVLCRGVDHCSCVVTMSVRLGCDQLPFRSSRCRSLTSRHASSLMVTSFRFHLMILFENGGQHLRSVGRADAKIPGYRSGSPVRLRWIELWRSSYLFPFLISRS